MIKKIPQIVLTKINAKGDYKSSDLIKVRQAYHKTYDMVKGTLNHFNLQTPDQYEGFATLYFPGEKAIGSSEDTALAKNLIELRDATSVINVMKLSKANPWFMTFLNLSLNFIVDQSSLSFEILSNLSKELI